MIDTPLQAGIHEQQENRFNGYSNWLNARFTFRLRVGSGGQNKPLKDQI